MLRDRNFWIGAVVGGLAVYFVLPKVMAATSGGAGGRKGSKVGQGNG